MVRTITTLLLALLLSLPLSAGHNNAVLLSQTVQPLRWATDDKPPSIFCTVFSVSPKVGGWMGAKHCAIDPKTSEPRTLAFFVGDHSAVLVGVDPDSDIALFRTDDYHPTIGLALAKEAPVVGDSLETMGYPWGNVQPFYNIGYVSLLGHAPWEFVGMVGHLAAMGGQSGSPIVNEAGAVVGVASESFGGTEYTDSDPYMGMVTYEAIKTFDRGWVFDAR